MADRLSPRELARLRDEGTYLDAMKAAMQDFCFTIDKHTGRDRVWFGVYTVTINRNIAFNFFEQDVGDDPGLEPYPVIRSDGLHTASLKIQPVASDPSSAYTVAGFYIPRRDFEAAVRSMEDILHEYPDFRTLPDAYFPDAAIIRLLKDHLLAHPDVKAERANDWPALL